MASACGGATAAGAACFDAAGHLLDGHEQHRNQTYAQDGRDEHAREDGHPHHLAPFGAGAGRRQQRNDTEDEREGRHQDRTEAKLRRRHRRLHERLSRLEFHLRELDDQDRVLRGEANEHDQPDLGEDVVHVAGAHEGACQVEPEVRPEGRKRRPEQHAERQAPALVLRGQDEEHEEDRQREHRGHTRGPAFLKRQICPVEGHVRRQHFARGLLERIERLRRRVSPRQALR